MSDVIGEIATDPTTAKRGPSAAWRALWKTLGYAPVRNRYVIENVWVPLANGTRLAADLYRPVGLESPATILIRTPYGRGELAAAPPHFFAARGLTVLIQSSRGTDGSEGEFEPMITESSDAQDTLAWLRVQPWFDGRLITYGQSYLGFVQWALAENPPPELIGMVVDVGPHDFAQVAWGRGEFDLDNFIGWSNMMSKRDDSKKGMFAQVQGMKRDEKHVHELLRTRPLEQAVPDRFPKDAPWYAEWLAHPDVDDPFWNGYRYGDSLHKVTCPVLLSGGWQDLFLRQTLEQWRTLAAEGVDLEVVVGGWTHIDMGKMLASAYPNRVLRWIDRLLAGQAPVAAGDRYEVQIMGGKKQWRSLEQWPPAAIRTTLFLRQDGALSWDVAPEGTASFVFDPAAPTPSIGGHTMASDAGVKVNNAIEGRDDVLVFTSDKLTEDLVVIGHPTCMLDIESSDSEHDVFVRLCDVDPRGRSRNVTDEIVRRRASDFAGAARGREILTIELQGTAHRFAKGHRIRMQVSGGAFPRYSANPGSARDETGRPVPVTNTLHFGLADAGVLALPVEQDAPRRGR